MALLDWLTGNSSLKRQRDANIRSAEQMYDPSIFNPVMNEQRQRAVEGMPQGQRDIARQRTVQQLFRPQDTSLYGGNQAAAIAGTQAQSRGAQQGLAQFESNLQSQNIQTQQQARQQFAQTQSQAMQTAGQRDATIDQIEGQYEAERSRRKQGLMGGVASLVGAAVTTPFGPAGQTLAGKALGSVFRGGDDSESVSASQAPDVDSSVGVGSFVDNIGGIFNPLQNTTNPTPQQLPEPQQQTQANTQSPSQPQTPQQPQFNFVEEMLGRPQQQQSQQPGLTNPQILPDENTGFRETQGQQQPQQNEFLGDRIYGDVPDVMGNIAGPVGRGAAEVGTFPFRQAFNLADVTARGVAQGLAQPERQEIAKLQELYGDNWEQEIENLRSEFQGADLSDRYLRQLLISRSN